jgi:hypothetical protein
MTDLLALAVAAHGGLDRFNQFKTVSAHLVLGGRMWALKGQEGVMSNARIRVTVDLQQEWASLAPFKLPNHYTDFTPERVAVETTEGVVVEERTNPRAAFAGHTRQTPWDDLHFIYFASYAMWTYLTIPFSLTWAGFEVAEIEPWHEQGETWRRLKVKFPPHIASHSTEQTFYFGEDGLLRRHDYEVEISGNTPAAHFVSDYQDVSGIMIPTKRRVFTRRLDNSPALDTVLISIDLSEIRFD